MAVLYLILIALAAFPLLLTIWRMQAATKIKKNGIHTNAIIIHISTIRTRPGGVIDILTLEYKDSLTGQPYKGKATVTHMKHKTGEIMPVVYLQGKPSKYAIDTKKTYRAVLIFAILLFAFVLFAVYKINQMVETGEV